MARIEKGASMWYIVARECAMMLLAGVKELGVVRFPVIH